MATDNTPATPAPEGAIMSDRTAADPPESGQDRFDALLVRLVFLVSRLNLAAEDLSAIGASEEHSSAASVVQEAAQDLAQLYDAFGTFDGEHDYTPRDSGKSWRSYAGRATPRKGALTIPVLAPFGGRAGDGSLRRRRGR